MPTIASSPLHLGPYGEISEASETADEWYKVIRNAALGPYPWCKKVFTIDW